MWNLLWSIGILWMLWSSLLYAKYLMIIYATSYSQLTLVVLVFDIIMWQPWVHIRTGIALLHLKVEQKLVYEQSLYVKKTNLTSYIWYSSRLSLHSCMPFTHLLFNFIPVICQSPHVTCELDFSCCTHVRVEYYTLVKLCVFCMWVKFHM